MNLPPPPQSPFTQPYGQPARVKFEVLNEAWALFKQQSGVWIGAICLAIGAAIALYIGMFIAMFAAVGPEAFNSPNVKLTDHQATMMLVVMGTVGVAGWILMTLITAGLHNMALKQVRGEITSIADMFSVTSMLPNILLASILTWLAMVAGMILCVFPYYIVNGMLMFTLPLIIDQRMGAIEAMNKSWNALKSNMLMATLFMFIMPMVASLGIMACGIGIVVTLPLYFLAIAITYRDFFIWQSPPSYGYPPAGYPPQPYTPESAYPPPVGGPLDFNVTPPPVEEENRPPKPDETG
jgi:hypothetical protein